jgi:hypothetical protein
MMGATPMTFDDDDPIWEQHTGGSGHSGLEWKDGDQERARVYYDSIADGTRRIFGLLMDRPGELVDAREIYRHVSGRDWREGDPNWRKSVAARLNSIKNVPSDGSGRRIPFYWWGPSGHTDTRYGMKPTVAQIFRDARRASAK